MIYLKTSVGIELRGEDLLIASLQSNFSGSRFTHFKRIANYRAREQADLRQEVQQFFKSAGLSKDTIILGIPRKDIVLRQLDLPVEVADNLRQVVQYQVQSFEPTEEDKFYFDYSVLDRGPAAKRLSIQLVMVRKSLLDGYLQLLRGIGLRPAAVMAGSMGLANLFLQNHKDVKGKIYFLVDLSPSAFEVLALRDGAIAYTREAVKSDNQSWKDLLLCEAEEAISKMRLSPESAVERILLAGESSESAFAEIREDVADCELIKKHIRGEIPEETKPFIQEAAAALGLACVGLARRPAISINLLPAEMKIRQTRWAYVPAAILGLAILALLIALGFHRIVQERKLILELDRQIGLLKGPVEKVQGLKEQSETLQNRSQSITNLLHNRDRNLEVLRELTTILPTDTYLNTYSNRDGLIQIGGHSGSAYDLMPKLEKSPILKDVVQKGSIFKDAATGLDRFSFEMKLEK